MKSIVVSLLVIFVFITPSFAGFDDFLMDVLTEANSQSIGSEEYVFAPGDAVIQTETYAVYYTGFELAGTQKTLLLTLVSRDANLGLKFPNPQTIRVREYQLQILAFDQSVLKIKLLGKRKG